MTDYNTLKVPELKKLLQGRGLSVTGNKADLVARLTENDKQTAPVAGDPEPTTGANDEIHWSEDDEPAPAAATTATSDSTAAAAKPSEAVAAATDSAPAAGAAAPQSQPDESAVQQTLSGEAKAVTETEEPKEDFALHLDATDVSEETRKRAERAKRFGITDDSADEDAKKKADRAKRFGVDAGDLASGLDAALPERKPKRGRGGEGDQDNRESKRQTTGGRDGRESRDSRDSRRGRGFRGGRGRQQGAGRPGRQGGRRQEGGGAVVDQAEKARMDARAKRFAAAS